LPNITGAILDALAITSPSLPPRGRHPPG